MIVACFKCGEEFLLTQEHKGFANVCEACFLPRKLSAAELKAAKDALEEKNRLIREENNKQQQASRAKIRREIEAGWSSEEAQKNIDAFRDFIGNRFPDDDESFVYFFREMKESKRRKFYL